MCMVRKPHTIKCHTKASGTNAFEWLLIEISGMAKILAIYRPPSSPGPKFLDELCELLTTINCSNCLMVGDFNLPSCASNINAEFNSLINSFNLHNNVTQSTHRSGNSLDMVITSLDSTDTVETLVQPPVNWSDHYPITIYISSNTTPNTAARKSLKCVRNWSCVNKSTLKNLLSSKPHPPGTLDEITATLYNNLTFTSDEVAVGA